MSDHELREDLFGDSDGEAPQRSVSSAGSVANGGPPEDGNMKESAQLAEAGDENGGDLFGDDDEEPSRGKSSPSTARSSASPHPLEYAEEDVPLAEAAETWATLPLPLRPRLKPTDGKVWHMKLPAYVNFDSRPYDADLYRATLDEEEIDGKTDPVAARSRMIGVRNTMRWRWVTGPDGEPMRQSNARMVRWSDGSVSLQLGSDLFDVAPSYGTTLARPTDPQPKASAANDKPAPSSTFLVVSAKEEEVLMTERAVAGQLSIVPTSMTSKTHLELAKHVGQQHAKASKMKILGDDIRDPEQINKLLRQAAGTNPVKVSRTRSKTERKTSSSRRKRGAWSSDEEGYESDEPRAGRKVERDAGEYDEDDGFVVADDDDEEEEEKENSDDAAYGSKRKSGNKKKSKRRKSESLDEMEEAERRIEAAERERKRAKKDKGGGSGSKSRDYVDTDEEDAEGEPDLDEDMEMDVESEED